MRFEVTVNSTDVVEVDARSKAEAKEMVLERGADDFKSVWYESEVVLVKMQKP